MSTIMTHNHLHLTILLLTLLTALGCSPSRDDGLPDLDTLPYRFETMQVMGNTNWTGMDLDGDGIDELVVADYVHPILNTGSLTLHTHSQEMTGQVNLPGRMVIHTNINTKDWNGLMVGYTARDSLFVRFIDHRGNTRNNKEIARLVPTEQADWRNKMTQKPELHVTPEELIKPMTDIRKVYV